MAYSLLVLLDDIASVLDDVALMTKVAAKKTAGVLGDDLALNAQQVSGVKADRELPVVWAVAKGSLRNKAILVPAALAISAFAPVLITPLLMLGGAYLCFEGVEKLAHRWLHSADDDRARRDALARALTDPALDLAAVEADKIRGAVRTDFILSAEIVTITLGTVADASLAQQFSVLAGIALLMTVGVYGLVAGIVKLDDAGLWLSRRPGAALANALGRSLLAAAPWLMKGLAVVGTLAMFLVGGGILTHGIAPLHEVITAFAGAGRPLVSTLLPLLANLLVGLAAGALVLAAVQGWRRWRPGAAARP
jgi:predicted DNA repair protein MutK